MSINLEVPKKWRPYTKANAEFFEGLDSPGGAANLGKVSNDPQFIKDLPPRE